MFFCPDCNFLLDLAKSGKDKNIKKITIKKVIDFIDLVNKNEQSKISKILFSEDKLKKNKDYKKIKGDKQKEVLSIFKNITRKKTPVKSNVNFYCRKCGFVNKLNSGTIVYRGTTEFTNENDNVTFLRKNDSTLPRTKDYICPNKECNSHKNTVDKEAIFYRPSQNSYELKYLCMLCDTTWNP